MDTLKISKILFFGLVAALLVFSAPQFASAQAYPDPLMNCGRQYDMWLAREMLAEACVAQGFTLVCTGVGAACVCVCVLAITPPDIVSAAAQGAETFQQGQSVPMWGYHGP